MEIAEIRVYGVQKHYVLFAPLIQAVFYGAFFYDTEQDFAHEHCHGIFEKIVPDAVQRVFRNNVLYRVHLRILRRLNVRLKDVQRKEPAHRGLFPQTAYEKSPPSVLPAKGMYYG